MWQDQLVKCLRDELEEILKSLRDVDDLYLLAREPLEKPRRGLAKASLNKYPWPVLPLIVCDVISGEYKHALPAAASLQLLMAAGDVFDDIEDNDSSNSLLRKYGSAVATNVATTLLILAESTLTRLKTYEVENSSINQIIEKVNSYYTTACIGQHMDIALVSRKSISEEEYMNIIGLKSASQIECACHIGSLLANANDVLIDLFTQFGYNLGMSAQLSNDIQGIVNESDIIKKKITLPMIYALNQTDNQESNQIKLLFSRESEDVPNPTIFKDLLFSTGAIHFTMIKLEYYIQLATDNLSDIEKEGINTKRLKLFL